MARKNVRNLVAPTPVEPRKPLTIAELRQIVQHRLHWWIEDFRTKQAEFMKKIGGTTGDCIDRLRWDTEAMLVVAIKAQIAEECLTHRYQPTTESPVILDPIEATLAHLMRRAKRALLDDRLRGGSTSVMSNLEEACRRQAFAKVLEAFDCRFDSEMRRLLGRWEDERFAGIDDSLDPVEGAVMRYPELR